MVVAQSRGTYRQQYTRRQQAMLIRSKRLGKTWIGFRDGQLQAFLSLRTRNSHADGDTWLRHALLGSKTQPICKKFGTAATPHQLGCSDCACQLPQGWQHEAVNNTFQPQRLPPSTSMHTLQVYACRRGLSSLHQVVERAKLQI